MRLTVVTPVRQLVAAAVDFVLGGLLVAGACRAALAGVGIKVSSQGLIDVVHAEPLSLIPVVVMGGLVLFLWHLLPLLLSASPGQRLMRLRLVDVGGHKPAFFRLLVRAVFGALSTAFCFAGPAWGLLVDGKRRGLHDVVAGTVVVQK